MIKLEVSTKSLNGLRLRLSRFKNYTLTSCVSPHACRLVTGVKVFLKEHKLRLGTSSF